jgi:hypothetical protein
MRSPRLDPLAHIHAAIHIITNERPLLDLDPVHIILDRRNIIILCVRISVTRADTVVLTLVYYHHACRRCVSDAPDHASADGECDIIRLLIELFFFLYTFKSP